ncbi:MAG: tol-pal system protein YbgF, partial [Candidatus Zixiibacteriota bacterium]
RKQINRLDSITTAEAEANRLLRNDLHISIAELQKEIAQLLTAYQDLTAKIDQLTNRQVIPKTTPPIPDVPDSTTQVSHDCDTLYDATFAIMRGGKFETALAQFAEFVATCPNAIQVPDARYWMGECLFSLTRFQEALDSLENFSTTYPASPKLPQALYKVGRCYQELKKNQQARKAFDKVVKQFPRTIEADNAQDRLKEMKK